jgi:hypothetical protein
MGQAITKTDTEIAKAAVDALKWNTAPEDKTQHKSFRR